MNRLKSCIRGLWGQPSMGWKSLISGIVIVIILLIIPTGFEEAYFYKGADKVSATVLQVDDTAIRNTGLIRSGEQRCFVKIDHGRFKGKSIWAVNLLSGSLSQDKEFYEGDKALVVVSYQKDEIKSVTMIDHYRIHWELILLVIFTILLVAFAGPGGIRALLSFFITILCLWKILIPYALKGGDALLCGLLVISIITIVIIFSVYGFDRKSLVAITGSMLGVLTACILGIVFTKLLKIHGAIMTDSESLLYAGYEHLNLTRIFMAGIYIGASGAMMDLAVDITSGINEVICKKSNITRLEAIGSGIRIGQAAMGTMTTTLLLAYVGSCLSQLMVFMAQGTPLINILNYKYVASEILQTLVGSFALVTVAPFTAIIGGMILVKNK